MVDMQDVDRPGVKGGAKRFQCSPLPPGICRDGRETLQPMTDLRIGRQAQGLDNLLKAATTLMQQVQDVTLRLSPPGKAVSVTRNHLVPTDAGP